MGVLVLVVCRGRGHSAAGRAGGAPARARATRGPRSADWRWGTTVCSQSDWSTRSRVIAAHANRWRCCCWTWTGSRINDTFGHLVGDRVLIEVADTLATAVRAEGTLARQGGDEFSILAPNTSDEQAARLE
ncbi:MAG: GGDEF domain-containing protein [Solirubrobacteraceae bacterium]